MKIGMRKPSIKKSLKARTTGKLKRSIKRAIIPGFSNQKDENESNINNIEKFIKSVNEVKIICFIINGNTTRFTEGPAFL